MTTPPPPPGWYPDPWGFAPTRWWDGYRWTEHTTLPGASGFPPAGGGFGYQPALLKALHQRESELWKWARFALLAWAIVALLEAALAIVLAGSLRNEIHTIIHDVNTNQPGPTNFNSFGFGWSGAFNVLYLVNLVLAIGFLMWQLKAATVARDLGYASTLSPGWGIVMWFIPIANLFMPVIVLRDLLPRNHPLRPRAIPAWVCYVATGILDASIIVVGYFSLAAAVIPLLLAVGCVVTATRLGLQLLEAVRDEHAQAVAALR
jgi:hypothetical protein